MTLQTSLTEYYLNQAQTGQGMGYYSGIHGQRGHGLGTFLGGLFRTVLPFLGRTLKSGARSVGSEALRAGTGILSDIVSGQNPQEAAKRRIGLAGRNLYEQAASKIQSKMRGNGIKRGHALQSVQSGRITRKTNNAPRRSKAKLPFRRDVFN